MIIDCHCHAGHGDRMTAPWNTVAPLGEYLRRARAAGIQRTVILAPLHSNYVEANEEVARIIARMPGRLVGFACLHPKRDAGRIARMVQRAVLEHGFRGIKVHGMDAMPSREVCEAARAFEVPIFVDVINRPHVIEMLAPQFPRVNFIIAHLGSFGDDFRAHQVVIDQLVRHANVYADTSGVRRFDYLVEAVSRAGSHKLLFGSDGPWLHSGLELHKIRLLRLPPNEQALILGGNTERLLFRTSRRMGAHPGGGPSGSEQLRGLRPRFFFSPWRPALGTVPRRPTLNQRF